MVALAASEVLVRGLDQLGVRFRLQEGLLGLLTALGADAPEISSALLSLHAGAADLGVGVVLGSNIFNLAALLGLGAFVAGHIRVRRIGLALNGSMVVVTTLLAGGLLVGVLPPVLAVLLMLLFFIPYVVILALQPHQVDHLPVPHRAARLLVLAVEEISHEVKAPHVTLEPSLTDRGRDQGASRTEGEPAAERWRPLLLIGPALLVIVLASDGMVVAAVNLAAHWGLPSGLMGAVVLAGLTSLPNAYAAVRLALAQRGSAVVSEAFNSNTINMLAGVCLPALVLNLAGADGSARFDLLWLLGMSGVTIALLARRRGLTRAGGAAIITLYVLFVALRLRG